MMHLTIDGTYADTPCGYCKLHKASITVKQLKNKQCIQKHCYHLCRYWSHPYWKQRENTKELRKARKERLNNV